MTICLFSAGARRVTEALLVMACLVAPALAQGSGNCTVTDSATRPDCAAAISFFEKVQVAVKAGDEKQLASMVNYPLRASQHGKAVRIRTKAQFLKAYPQLFTGAVVCAIKAAKDSDVWGNYQGFMVGDGVIWWDQIIPASVKNPQPDSGKYPFKIITLNNENVMAPGCGENKH